MRHARLKLCVFLALALSISAQTLVKSPVWVTGDGAAHAIATSGFARTVTVYALPTNSGTSCSSSTFTACPTVGDLNVVVGSRGFPLLPGAAYTFSILPGGQPGYSLAQIFYAAASGDKLVFVWAQ